MTLYGHYIFYLLVAVASSSPCPAPSIRKRQFAPPMMGGGMMASGYPGVGFGFDNYFYPDPSYGLGMGSAAAASASAAASNENMVGNSLAQIDNSTNMQESNIEYPGESRIAGNTGTSVSGDNNDIMPVINAPVTVIINDSDTGKNKQRIQPPPSQRFMPPRPRLPYPFMRPQLQPQMVSPMMTRFPNTQPAAAFGRFNPHNARIQRLVAYALQVSQQQQFH